MPVRSTSFRRAVIVASAAVLLPSSASAAAAPVSAWHAVHLTVRPGKFYSVTAAGQRHAWAVGGSPSRRGLFAPLVARWDGAAWAPVRLPTKLRSQLGPLPLLDTVVASGPRNLWAFSLTGGWLHYNGSSWTAGLLPAVLTTTASAVAGTHVWSFGLRPTFHAPAPYSAYATDIHGKMTWKFKAIPGNATIYGASAVSASDLWAVGTSGPIDNPIGDSGTTTRAGTPRTASSLLHYYAGHWHRVMPLPASMRTNPATSILARSDTDIWVGGAVRNARTGTSEAIAHWNGRSWNLVKLPVAPSKDHYRTQAITADDSTSLWALADCFGTRCPNHGPQSRLWHEQAGHWTGPSRLAGTSHPTALYSIATVGPIVWAAGTVTLGKNNVHGLIAAKTLGRR
jgi:hypothetical protein